MVLLSAQPTKAYAVQNVYVAGSAPFINQWLVAGPFNTPVADNIYGTPTATTPPSNPDITQTVPGMTATASTTYPNNPISQAIDGTTSKQWLTNGSDPSPWLNIAMPSPQTIATVGFATWGDNRFVNSVYNVVFTHSDYSTTEYDNIVATSSSSQSPTLFNPPSPEQNVTSVKIFVDPGNAYTAHQYSGLSEVYLYQYPMTQTTPQFDLTSLGGTTATSTNATYSTDTPPNAIKPLIAFTSHGSYPANNGKVDWASTDPNPSITVTFPASQSLTSITFKDRTTVTSATSPDKITAGVLQLYDASGNALYTQNASLPTAGINTATFNAVNNVKYFTFSTTSTGASGGAPGFSQISAYYAPNTFATNGNKIAQVQGQAVDSTNYPNTKWEYFDDRLYNRNYDDYNDLYGYYAVKQGTSLDNNYLLASTYVYSPTAQSAYFDVGSSGIYRMYVNDAPVMNPPHTSANIQKQMTSQQVSLNAGWNKLLIQIYDNYAPPANPTGAETDQKYCGFYARLADSSGNALPGLIYSAAGDPTAYSTNGSQTSQLAIVTQPLKQAGALTSNALPLGYQGWPYVALASTGNPHPQASLFYLQASGGVPAASGYTWSIVSGALPSGLTLAADGSINGTVSSTAAIGDYAFTARVTDGTNAATKQVTLTVQQSPSKWFADAHHSTETESIVIPNWFMDPNFSPDQWAKNAHDEGISFTAIETNQQAYYWPSQFNNAAYNAAAGWGGTSSGTYSPIDPATGKVANTLAAFVQAIKRYNMYAGFYVASSTPQQTGTDSMFEDVTTLINLYKPSYFYFDGPQGTPANLDVVYSAIRDYSNSIIIEANQANSAGDVDAGTSETPGAGYKTPQLLANYTQPIVPEPWIPALTLNSNSAYYGTRDDFRENVKQLAMYGGIGYVFNNDQIPLDYRGTKWNLISMAQISYPQAVQEVDLLHENAAAWFTPPGLPNRYESIIGTSPYDVTGNGNATIANFANGSLSPDWGFANSRDNNIYLHVVNMSTGVGNKTGFSASSLSSGTMSVYVANKVNTLYNLTTGALITGWSQSGNTLSINVNDPAIVRDPVDTILKIVTNPTKRNVYHLTDLDINGNQISDTQIQLSIDGYMTYPELQVPLTNVSYTSDNSSVASVSSSGLISAIAVGSATITVSGTYLGETQSKTYPVTVKNGVIFNATPMIGAYLKLKGFNTYTTADSNGSYSYQLSGQSNSGNTIGMNAATVAWHSGTVAPGTNYDPDAITETNTISVQNGTMTMPAVTAKTRMAVWADVNLNGQSFTSNRVYIDLLPTQNLATTATTTDSNGTAPAVLAKLVDGQYIFNANYVTPTWTADGGTSPWMQFNFGTQQTVSDLQIVFNRNDVQSFINLPSSLAVSTSNDGTNWTTVTPSSVQIYRVGNGNPTASTLQPVSGSVPTTATANYFGSPVIYTLPAGTTAQYVRIGMTGTAGTAIALMQVAIDGNPSQTATPPRTPTAGTYSINGSAHDYVLDASFTPGTVTANMGSANAGQLVTVYASPALGYGLVPGSITVTGADSSSVTVYPDGTFIMPSQSVGLSAQFVALNTINTDLNNMKNGILTPSFNGALPGQTINVRVTPTSGYTLVPGSLGYYTTSPGVITPITGNSFTMPSTNVTLTAQFAPTAVTGVALDQTSLTFTSGTGGSATLNVVFTPSVPADKFVRWSSDNSAVASVDSNGNVTLTGAPGVAHITVTTDDGGFIAVCTITVNPSNAGVSLNSSAATLLLNNDPTLHTSTLGTVQLIATVFPVADSVTWQSNNTAVATVDANGLVTAVGIGQASVKATSATNGYQASSVVTVLGDDLAVGRPASFYANLNYASGTTMTGVSQSATWAPDKAVQGTNATGANNTAYLSGGSQNGPAYLQVDLGTQQLIGTVGFSGYSGCHPTGLVIMLSNDSTFQAANTTVVYNDNDNTTAYTQSAEMAAIYANQGFNSTTLPPVAAHNGVYFQDSASGALRMFNLPTPVSARYIRVWNTGVTEDGPRGRWQEVAAYAPVYQVTFNSNGGSTVATQQVVGNTAVASPAAPTRNGYTFAGWTDASGNNYDFTAPVTGNVTITAKWASG